MASVRPIHRFATAALLAFLATAACGKDATGVSASLNGTWSGSAQGISVQLNLTESTDSVTGTGSLSGPSIGLAITVIGTRSRGDVNLWFSANGYVSASYAAQFANDNTLSGTLSGSGFNNVSLSLLRR